MCEYVTNFFDFLATFLKRFEAWASLLQGKTTILQTVKSFRNLLKSGYLYKKDASRLSYCILGYDCNVCLNTITERNKFNARPWYCLQ